MFHGLPLKALVINQSKILLDPLCYSVASFADIRSVCFEPQKDYWPYALVHVLDEKCYNIGVCHMSYCSNDVVHFCSCGVVNVFLLERR